MYRILLAVDTDRDRAERIIEAVLSLPAPNQHVEAIIFHCAVDETEEVAMGQIRSVQDVKGRLESAEIDVSLQAGNGDPAVEIVNAAAEEDVDAIYIAGRKRSPTGKVLFGSVAQQVALNTDRPVVMCGRERLAG